MSKNDGGDPIRLSKEPVEGPEIRRGEFRLPRSWRQVSRPGEHISFTALGGGYRVTYHQVPIIGCTDDDLLAMVAHDTLVTWERWPEPVVSN